MGRGCEGPPKCDRITPFKAGQRALAKGAAHFSLPLFFSFSPLQLIYFALFVHNVGLLEPGCVPVQAIFRPLTHGFTIKKRVSEVLVYVAEEWPACCSSTAWRNICMYRGVAGVVLKIPADSVIPVTDAALWVAYRLFLPSPRANKL